MAGVVASTLRRKAFKKSGVALYPAVEGKGQQSLEIIGANPSCSGSTAASTIVNSSATTHSPTVKLANAAVASTSCDRDSLVSDASSIVGSPTSPYLSTSSSTASDQDNETSQFCPKRKEKSTKSRQRKVISGGSVNHRTTSSARGHKTKSGDKSSKHSKHGQRRRSTAEENSADLRGTDNLRVQGNINSRLCQVDFWPSSLTPYELNIEKVKLESFDMLIPKANIWLLENPETRVIKCETIEKKIYSLDDVFSQNVLFRPLVHSKLAFYVKGLRIWYVKNLHPMPGCLGDAVKTAGNENRSKQDERSRAQTMWHNINNQHQQLCTNKNHSTQQHQQCCNSPRRPCHSQHCCSCTPTSHPTSRLDDSKNPKEHCEDYDSFCAYSPALDDDSLPLTIGYMNVIPRCISYTNKYPEYEDLPETYSAVCAYLSDYPLEGKIVTIETVPLKLTNHRARQKPEIDPNQTFVPDAYLRHILYITRIFFRYGKPTVEVIGAQDFLPDKDMTSSFFNFKPQFKGLSTAMSKVQNWIRKMKDVSVINIQTLEAAIKQNPVDVRTGSNFIDKSESHSTVKFVRVSFTKPTVAYDQDACLTTGIKFSGTQPLVDLTGGALDGGVFEISGGSYLHSDLSRHRKSSRTDPISDFVVGGNENNSAPFKGFAYKTFVPAPVKVAMCSGIPQYEEFVATLERAKIWMKCVNRRIISVESLSHPLTNIWDEQDGGEATVCHGEWTSSSRKNRRYLGRRRSLVYLVRVYLDGPYQEPSAHLIPPTPLVEEIKDCACAVM